MKSLLSKNQIIRFEKQILLKEIGVLGQKKITKSKVLVIGIGGLGCPVVDVLSRAGIGNIGIVDDDFVKKETKPNYNDNENIIVDMNDIRNIMREFIIHKIDSDMEEVIKKYLNDKIISDDNNWN